MRCMVHEGWGRLKRRPRLVLEQKPSYTEKNILFGKQKLKALFKAVESNNSTDYMLDEDDTAE